MEKDLQDYLEAQDKKIEEIFSSMEKIRKYFLWSFIFNVAMIVLPLGAVLAIIPWFLSKLAVLYQGI